MQTIQLPQVDMSEIKDKNFTVEFIDNSNDTPERQFCRGMSEMYSAIHSGLKNGYTELIIRML